MKAVIMAGGEGTRLRPLTARRPKPLAPVMNLPIMEHSVNLLRQHGITDILFTLYYMADEIEGYFGDGSRWGVKFQSAIQDTPLGTAGGLMLKKEFLSDETFIIISGDALTDLDITRALQFHRDRQSEATLVLSQVPNPLEFGVVITDEVGRIRRFLEKPSWGEVFSDTVNTGMYILEPSVLERMELGQNYDWSQDIFPAMLAEGRSIHGYIMDGYWCDVGNLNQYREAQYAALDGRVKMQVPGVKVGDVGAVLFDRARVGVLEPGDNPQERRLARPRWPEQGQERAVGNVERHVVERRKGSEVLGDVANMNAHGQAASRVASWVVPSADRARSRSRASAASRCSMTNLTTRVTSARPASTLATAIEAGWRYS
jgi:NDP-sugar pyrophosphorylase family protein